MSLSKASPSADISLYCTDKELFMSLEKMMAGSPLPDNVLPLNPYDIKPDNLPVDIWFFNQPNENKDTRSSGRWKTKGEACELFSNSSFIGWRSTLEFYEGQAPHEHKTDWVMQEYWITLRLSEDVSAMGPCSLCRVFLVQNADTASHSTESVVQNAENYVGQSSSSRQQVNKTGNLSVRERIPVENAPEIDYVSRGDYMELLDLDTPVSPSSSSDSSCVTMSSNECFDSLALLQDLEPETNNEPVQKDAGCKFNIAASIKPTEVVICPAFSGTLDKSPNEQVPGTDRSTPGSALLSQISDKNNLKNPSGNQKPDFRNEGTSSNSERLAATCSSYMAAPREEKKPSIARKGSLKKYCCCLPF
ncbi:NAC domain-containing protein 83 [Ziziphus jujuba]|uniref:NAC domain-containing protein 83 n=1 Tax=Ziziphus jujuba TaxID=326968 RepID=A0ABM3IN18_ZIZJJ|nr:NAC domain-containing protein 83 [Ziziphus jujuba]XP_048331957.2 NAC domain-containing protein 83 [Ziziphus jujuba]